MVKLVRGIFRSVTDEEQRIRQLLHDGRNREAAEMLITRGELKRAMEAYAAVWDYAKAAEVAIAAADRAAALDYLLRDGNRSAAAEVRAKLAAGSADEAERAVTRLLDRGEKDQAARLLEAIGEFERSADLARELGELRRAAALLERAGKMREAGRLYERLLAEDPEDGPTALSLGGILRRFGRHEPAARMYQVAARRERLKRTALRGLVVSLAGMGLAEAADAALKDLLEVDGSAPRTVEALLSTETGTGEMEGEQWVGGRYQIVKLLGGGAAGRVYLARDALYEREVALKIISAGSGETAGRDAFSRFVREAQIAAKLDHPNIVRVLDFDETAGFLVMEHLGGGTLADRIAEGGYIPLALVRDLLLGVLAALETAHLRGVIHRDIKPQNILFDRGGGVKIVDFGVAHLQDLGLTQTGAFIGTLAYMAPEQITGDKLSAATDLYGLGATVFHALCGRPPFVGTDLVRQHLSETPPRPSELRPALGTGFDDLMQRLLAKVPDQRFPSAADVRRAVVEIDITEPDDEEPGPASVPEPISSDENQETFVAVQPAREFGGGTIRRARHSRLDMSVMLITVTDAELLARLEALAKVISPYLQSVLDFDKEKAEVVLELPSGDPLAASLAAKGPLRPLGALLVCDQIATALLALHGSGQSHGEVQPDLVRCNQHRATLLLPSIASTDSTPTNDATALLDLLCRSLGIVGKRDLAGLLGEGPLADAIGRVRAAEISEHLPDNLEVSTLRECFASLALAIRERARARERLHALAAAARAVGADPNQSPLAEFFEQKRIEQDL